MSWVQSLVEYLGGEQRAAVLLAGGCFALLTVFAMGKLTLTVAKGVKGAVKRGRLRKLRRAEIQRQLQYVLPDGGDSYVRSRLHTALGEGTEESVSRQNVGVRLDYARKMVAKIRESKLSPVERLEVEEMARLVSLYLRQEKWTGGDLKAINEVFTRLLKLSAKYEVAV